jgi:glutathione S-transferase
MKLIGSKTSPFVRKARVIMAERSIPYEFVEANPWASNTEVSQYNALNKVPALVLDNGESLFDSVVIAEFLDATSGFTLIPQSPLERARVRSIEALADGIADAGLAVFLERKRETLRQDPLWIERQMSKLHAGIESLADRLGTQRLFGGVELNLADIAAACVLLWVEFRMPQVLWRDAYPSLGEWVKRMETRASFWTTRPG